MNLQLKKSGLPADVSVVFFKQLKQIYAAMDEAYNKVAGRYGFDCKGCKDNCCMTRFYHHTYLEYFYLLEGFSFLKEDIRKSALEQAVNICNNLQYESDNHAPARVMCPLNFDGLCILYDYRPMICRLHGIPHELRRPGQAPALGPGCEAFTEQCGTMAYIEFDRTPFYIEMSKLEQRLKQELGLTEKFKKTIAQMLVLF